jgi:hypothetical protein
VSAPDRTTERDAAVIDPPPVVSVVMSTGRPDGYRPTEPA